MGGGTGLHLAPAPVSLRRRRSLPMALLGLHRREQDHLLRVQYTWIRLKHVSVPRFRKRARFSAASTGGKRIDPPLPRRVCRRRPDGVQYSAVRTRMCALPVSSMTSRSTPMPKPPVGGRPYSSATQKSSSLLCASASPRCWSYVAGNVISRHAYTMVRQSVATEKTASYTSESFISTCCWAANRRRWSNGSLSSV